MTRIGVISDTHAHSIDELPRQLLSALKGLDMILHAGDLIDIALLEGLQTLGPPFRAVRGNMDSPQIRFRLAETEIIEIGQLRIGLTHGAGAPMFIMHTVLKKFKGRRLDCIVFGHTHKAMIRSEGGILFVNPGSVTDKVYAKYNSYAVLKVDQKIEAEIIRLP